MKSDRIDRRVQRTHQLLSDALIALIIEKGYEAITVQNIIDRANLGRSTFYTHYRDKEDLLLRGMETVVRALIWRVEDPLPEINENKQSRPIFATLPLFRHTQEHYRLYKAMVGGRGIDIMIKTVKNHLIEHMREHIEQLLPTKLVPSVPPVVMANYLAGALLTLLIWWLDSNMPYPPERMDEMFQELAMPGILAILGTTA